MVAFSSGKLCLILYGWLEQLNVAENIRTSKVRSVGSRMEDADRKEIEKIIGRMRWTKDLRCFKQ